MKKTVNLNETNQDQRCAHMRAIQAAHADILELKEMVELLARALNERLEEGEISTSEDAESRQDV